jgi:hypothetical protein
MFKKIISKRDDEFVVRVEEEDIGLDDGTEEENKEPLTYTYCHVENRFSNNDNMGWLTIADVDELINNLYLARKSMFTNNEKIGWKKDGYAK